MNSSCAIRRRLPTTGPPRSRSAGARSASKPSIYRRWMTSGNLAGVLPLVEQSSLLFGRFLSSVPFFTYGGILAQRPADRGGAGRRRRRSLARKRRARHVELRHSAPLARPDVGRPDRQGIDGAAAACRRSRAVQAARLEAALADQARRARGARPSIGAAPNCSRTSTRCSRAPCTISARRSIRGASSTARLAALQGAIDVLVIRVQGAGGSGRHCRSSRGAHRGAVGGLLARRQARRAQHAHVLGDAQAVRGARRRRSTSDARPSTAAPIDSRRSGARSRCSCTGTTGCPRARTFRDSTSRIRNTSSPRRSGGDCRCGARISSVPWVVRNLP